jgi:hypothetical protein
MLGGEVVTDDRDYANVREITCRQCEVSGRAAENILGTAGRSCDVVKSDGTDGEYAHGILTDRDTQKIVIGSDYRL